MRKKISVLLGLSTHQLFTVLPTLRLTVALSILTLSLQLVTVNAFAQFTKLHEFTLQPEGSSPYNSLVAEGSFLYGTTALGGTNNVGTIFRIKSDGTGYTTLFSFDLVETGRVPVGSLITDGTFLYGMAGYGSTNDGGTIFKIKLDGTDFTKLWQFGVTARQPVGSLIFDGTFLYGMTQYGGVDNYGIVFRIKPDGTAYAKLLDFDGTNGRTPYGDLILADTFLYGMTQQGGTNSLGLIFKIKPDGSMYSKVFDFAVSINGHAPQGALIFDGTFLYGMTSYGGANDFGTIFKIKPDGTGHSKLLDFDELANGIIPLGSLITDGTFLYGMAYAGGANGFGTIFKIKPDGSDFVKLLDFADIANGKFPRGSLNLDGNFLYGTASTGGRNGHGTVFKYALTSSALPSITSFTPISGPVGTNVIITGTDFSSTPSDNTVQFNGTVATVTASSSTSIATTVPVGASSGAITVTVDGNTATSTSNFTVTSGGIITSNESQTYGWKIYPNPFTTKLSIESPSKEKRDIEIVDVLGRSVKTVLDFDSDTILLEELENGSYILNIYTSKKRAHFRIIKAH